MRGTLVLLGLASAALAMESIDAAYLGMIPGEGVSAELASKYSQCLTGTMANRGAVAFVAPQSITDNMSGLSTENDCNRSCQAKLGDRLEVDGVLSATLKKNKDGYQSTLQVVRPDTNAKVEVITWQIVGSEKDLLGDGCKNGAGVIYNYLATPPTTEHPRWPKGFDLVKARESALDKGDVMKLVEELREEASRGQAMSQTNPDGDKAGRTGR